MLNFLEKIKLKSMLRHCDYQLAGTVLKQQYYDHAKNTELNRLIDAFMIQPCFESAIKIIQYNDMFVFYFTESCNGGLYVRKSKQDDVQSTAPEDELKVEQQNNNEAQSESAAEDSAFTPVLKKRSETHKASALQSSEPPGEDDEPDLAPIQEETGAAKEITESDLEQWVKSGKLQKLESSPATPTEVLFDAQAIDPKKTRFPNAVSTLQIDIGEMKRQMDEYQAQMYQDHREAVKIKKWMNALQDAIDEFTEAIKTLSRQ